MPLPSKPNPNWPRIAVVGCGYWGKNLVRNYAELGQLEALVDHHADHVQTLVAKHGGRTASFDEILSDKKIGAVVIATPGGSHAELGLAALEAGKHVFIEKPLTLSLAEAEKLAKRASDKQRILMVGHVLRYHAAFIRLEELVKAGALGRIRHISSTRFNLGKILDDEDVIWSLAPHDLSMAVALLGANPVSMTAQGDALLRNGITDMATLRLNYAGGTSVEIRLSWMSPVKEHKFVVIGERAMAIFDDTLGWDAKLTLYRPDLDWDDPAIIPAAGTPEKIPLPPMEPLRAECVHFLDCIATGARPKTDAREALDVTRLIDRACSSLSAVPAAQYRSA